MTEYEKYQDKFTTKNNYRYIPYSRYDEHDYDDWDERTTRRIGF